MKKIVAAYVFLAVVLTAISCAFLLYQPTFQTTLYAYSNLEDVTTVVEGDDIASVEIEPIKNSDFASIYIKSKNAGEGSCTIYVGGNFTEESGLRADYADRPEETGTFFDHDLFFSYDVKVRPSGLLMVNGQFTGGLPAVACSVLFLFALAIGLAVGFVRRKRNGLLCTYRTVAYLAFFLFVGASALALSFVLWTYFSYGEDFSLTLYVETMSILALFFAIVSIPFVAVVSLFLALSNVELIRHEGMRPTNMLGIAVGVFALVCYLGLYQVQWSFWSAEQLGAISIGLNIAIPYLVNFLGVIFVATVICGVMAAHNKPRLDKDFIIILGCGIRPDGTPTPLLAGRVQRAVDFAAKQQQETGKQAKFVCSGGQGADEVISEAACMANYLGEQGVDRNLVLLEDQSTNTWENMKFSRTIIDDAWGSAAGTAETAAVNAAAATEAATGATATAGAAEAAASQRPKVAYSTTNYHVFRSGTFALNAGLDAEGMGSKTKWYFWPNAFLREFVGFLVSSKGAILLTVVAVLAFSFGIAFVSTLA